MIDRDAERKPRCKIRSSSVEESALATGAAPRSSVGMCNGTRSIADGAALRGMCEAGGNAQYSFKL